MSKYTSMSVSFSEANLDAYELIKSQPRGTSSQYICDAVRFYEENRDKEHGIDKEAISEMIDDKLERILKEKDIVLVENRGTEKEKEISSIKDIDESHIAAIKNFRKSTNN